jgi:hypothetical protein
MMWGNGDHFPHADLSFLILSVYALVLTRDSNWGDPALVAHEGNDRQ